MLPLVVALQLLEANRGGPNSRFSGLTIHDTSIMRSSRVVATLTLATLGHKAGARSADGVAAEAPIDISHADNRGLLGIHRDASTPVGPGTLLRVPASSEAPWSVCRLEYSAHQRRVLRVARCLLARDTASRRSVSLSCSSSSRGSRAGPARRRSSSASPASWPRSGGCARVSGRTAGPPLRASATAHP
jgi:hypothetical protein